LRKVENKYFSVAHLSRLRGFGDGFDNLVGQRLVDRDLDFRLGYEFDCVFGATIYFRVTSLTAEAANLGHRDPLHADLAEGFAYVVEFERLDNCCD
jgi:hypothetical protein